MWLVSPSLANRSELTCCPAISEDATREYLMSAPGVGFIRAHNPVRDFEDREDLWVQVLISTEILYLLSRRGRSLSFL